jgi:hypothetical protein
MAWLGFSLPAEVSAGTAEQAKAEAPAAKDTVELVKAFLQTPTEQLPPDFIPEFLGIDPETLPKKLQQPYLAKRLELYTLKQLVEGKKKGIVRMPDADCSIPKESKSDSAGVLKMAGYETITDDEERWVMDKTKCTERDLMCEFTLQVVNTKGKKPGSERRLLFLNPRDPIFALIGQYRAVGRQKQTNFFGIGSPTCAPHN